MKDIKEFVLDRLQREYTFKEGYDIDNLNYIDEGYMDSLGLIQFIGELEDEFNIEFTDEEMGSIDFRIVGKLIKLIETKMEEMS